MMGFDLCFWWFNYCLFSNNIMASKASMSKNQEMQHKGPILVVIALVLLIFGDISSFAYCTWVCRSYSSRVLPPSQPQALWKQSDSSDSDWVLNVWINSHSITFLIWNMNLISLQNACMYIPECFVVVFNTTIKIFRTYWEGNSF